MTDQTKTQDQAPAQELTADQLEGVTAGSGHASGVQVLMGDGSVRVALGDGSVRPIRDTTTTAASSDLAAWRSNYGTGGG